MVATKAKFRGQSVARRLGEYLGEEALDCGLHGLFIEEVTVHTFTQKFCHRLGFVDTGSCWPAPAGDALYIEDIAGEASSRARSSSASSI